MWRGSRKIVNMVFKSVGKCKGIDQRVETTTNIDSIYEHRTPLHVSAWRHYMMSACCQTLIIFQQRKCTLDSVTSQYSRQHNECRILLKDTYLLGDITRKVLCSQTCIIVTHRKCTVQSLTSQYSRPDSTTKWLFAVSCLCVAISVCLYWSPRYWPHQAIHGVNRCALNIGLAPGKSWFKWWPYQWQSCEGTLDSIVPWGWTWTLEFRRFLPREGQFEMFQQTMFWYQ